MKNKQRRNGILSLAGTFIALSAVFVLFPSEADAQNRYGFPRGVSHEIVRRIARSAEERSDEFKRELNRALDEGRLDGTRREDRLNEQARRLENALDRVKNRVDNRRSYREVQDSVRQAVRAGRDINVTIRSRWMGSTVEREWRRLRAEINSLARTVRVSGIR